MKKKRATIGLSLIVTGAVCLVGCSNLAPSSDSTGTSNAAATVAYTFVGDGSGIEQIAGYSVAPGNVGTVVSSVAQTPPYGLGGRIATDQTGQVYSTSYSYSANNSTASVEIDVYPPYPTGVTSPSRSIQIPFLSVPAFGIFGLAVDSAGLLYVGYLTANGGEATVLVYSATASGAATPIRTLQLMNSEVDYDAGDMAVDAVGSLYVVGYATNRPYVWVYPPAANGPSMPSRTISVSEKLASDAPSGIAVDSKGDVFVNLWSPSDNGMSNDYIEEFAPGAEGAATPINTININVETPGYFIVFGGPLRLDGAGNIFASFEVFTNNIEAIAPFEWFIYGYEPTATGNQPPSVQIAPLLRDPVGDGAFFAVH